MAMLAELVELVIGVDTHTETHTAALVHPSSGALLETLTVATDPGGYDELLAAADRHGGLRAFAVEGAGGYGAGLARHLADAGEVVVELDRPTRPTRRGGRKSDPIDAERAARDALARTQLAAPKTGAQRGALAALQTARRSAVQAAGDAARQLRALVVTAPEQVRARFRAHRSSHELLTVALALRPGANTGDVEVVTTMTVLRELARRVRHLHAEAAAHEKAITAIVKSWRPDLLALPGVGPINAATVLVAWSHPGRCRDEAAFAMLAGVAPIPASSGKTVRYRLNRAGDRQLNRALHNIAVCRQRYHQPTRDYTERRYADGKSDREIRRCLKRYLARQLYRQLERPPATTP
jgi:transposase